MAEVSAVAAIAARDLLKLMNDRLRLVGSFIFPVVMITLLGGTLQANLGNSAGFNFVEFTFTGVLGMTIFQSTAQGIVSLLEDRQNDFSQELFVSPVSRYSIAFGKILGESLVALVQAAPLVVLALLIRVHLSAETIGLLFPAAILSCCLGGSFGLLAMAAINDYRAANAVFGFIILPQFFLAGVFAPITTLPWYLDLLSRLSPMRYIVDLFRGIVYAGRPEYHHVVLLDPWVNVLTMSAIFVVLMVVGTALFVRRETNR